MPVEFPSGEFFSSLQERMRSEAEQCLERRRRLGLGGAAGRLRATVEGVVAG
jgi:hypothetical protein